jgi:DNA-binding response OmpR family regulator
MTENKNVGAKILIVDDEPNVLRMVSYALNAEGFEVVVAQNGTEALIKVLTEAPDLVLLDVMLPDMSGVEVCEQLRKRQENIDLPIIMLSALDQVSDKVKCLEAGADEYVTKPIAPQELIARIKALLARFRQVRRIAPKLPGKVIGFMGVKGGVGNTTLALNIASALIMQEKKVVAAEIRSSYGTFSAQLNLEKPQGLVRLLELDLEKITEQQVGIYLAALPSGLRLLVGPQSVSEYRAVHYQKVEKIIQILNSMADYTILDLSCYPSDFNQVAIRQCDLVALVVEPESTALESGIIAIDLLRSWGVYGNRLGVIVVNRTPLVNPVKIDVLKTALGHEIIGVIPAAAEALIASQRAGFPVILSQPKSDVSKAYVDITKSISEHSGWIR